MEILTEWGTEWERALQEYKEEFRAAGMDWEGMGGLCDSGLGLTTQKEYNCSTYLYISEERKRLLGLLNLRQGQTKESLAQIGNIGFSIRPSEQRKGYATRMLQEAVPLSLIQGIIPWYMVCFADNQASKRVIARLGGRKQGEMQFGEGLPMVERYVVYDVF